MTRRRRIAVLAAVTGLALSACTNQDADLDDVREALEDTEALDSAQVDACVDRFEEANFTQDELNDIADAETLDDLPTDLGGEVRGLLEGCIEGSPTTAEGEGEGEGEGTGDGGEGSGEPSDTTTTEG